MGTTAVLEGDTLARLRKVEELNETLPPLAPVEEEEPAKPDATAEPPAAALASAPTGSSKKATVLKRQLEAAVEG